MDYFEEATDPLIKQAKYLYPILAEQDIAYKRNPQKDRGFLEFWPGDEPGSPESPRPKEFPMGKMGVEIFDNRTRPIDILGDVVSHHLVKTDPELKRYYRVFEESLTEHQRDILKEQYEHAKTDEGEKRPYADWYKQSGLPGFFRGYAFQQWENAEPMYTERQRRMFDHMMGKLERK
jgi:hypothetical protein